MDVRLLGAAALAVALVAAACGPASESGAGEPPAGPDRADPVPSDEDGLEDPWADFDPDSVRAEAESLLGLTESEVEDVVADAGGDVRIVRRGDEEYIVTMDLRPGRKNVELDEQDGTYVVTRVVVETPDGDDPIVVE